MSKITNDGLTRGLTQDALELYPHDYSGSRRVNFSNVAVTASYVLQVRTVLDKVPVVYFSFVYVIFFATLLLADCT